MQNVAEMVRELEKSDDKDDVSRVKSGLFKASV
jgi:hypothetical protein